MSNFEDEIRRMQELERQLRPYREIERQLRPMNLQSIYPSSALHDVWNASSYSRALAEGLVPERPIWNASSYAQSMMDTYERQQQLMAGSSGVTAITEALKRQNELLSAVQRHTLMDETLRERLRFPVDALANQHLTATWSANLSYGYQKSSIHELLEQFELTQQLRGAWLEPVLEDNENDDEESQSPSDIIVVQELTAELISELKSQPRNIFRISGREFELLVARLLERQGYEVEVTQATRDGGKDIIARLKSPAHSFVLYVECKRNSPENKVGLSIAQRLFGVVNEDRVSGGLIVTTSSFTEPVYDFQRKIPRLLSLKAYDDVMRWIADAH